MSGAHEFQDHFSDAPDAYAQSRPTYPRALFDWLATLVPTNGTVWDCATGSGQAAVELASRFARVIATDASANQLEHAEQRGGIEYRVATAEHSGLGDSSVDLVTCAQALHWFDFDRFYAEVRRVLKPGGVVAVWCYGVHAVEPAIDTVIEPYYHGTVGPFWPPERRHIDELYASIPFPFDRIRTPRFEMAHAWTLEQLLAYVRTWSATKRFVQDKGFDPVTPVDAELRRVWTEGETKVVRWPMGLMAGRIEA